MNKTFDAAAPMRKQREELSCAYVGLSAERKNRRLSPVAFLGAILLVGAICSGCKEENLPQIFGPFAINASGALLLCTIERDDVCQPYIISLSKPGSEPIALRFPGSDSCSGAVWIDNADGDRLLCLNGYRTHEAKMFRVSGRDVSEISSYPLDPNLLVTLSVDYLQPGGSILALRVAKLTSPSAYLAFSQDNARTITISNIRAPSNLLWTDDHTLYVTHGTEKEGELLISRVDLDTENMTWQEQEIVKGPWIALATGGLHGSLLYAIGNEIFRDRQLWCRLPEDISRPLVEGPFVVCVSRNHRTIYILNDKGEVIDVKQEPEGAIVIGASAARGCIYLTTEKRRKILAYNFLDKSEDTVFDVRKFGTAHSIQDQIK